MFKIEERTLIVTKNQTFEHSDVKILKHLETYVVVGTICAYCAINVYRVRKFDNLIAMFGFVCNCNKHANVN